MTLVSLWLAHKAECIGVGAIIKAARAGALPGVQGRPDGRSFEVIDEQAALQAIRKENAV
jgi:hypothetical protein